MTYRETKEGSITLNCFLVLTLRPGLPSLKSMKCPSCGHSNDRVLDTREQRDGQTIRRRRECMSCKNRFTTTESVILTFPFLIKKDGRREPFSREKLLRGLQAACQKRPIDLAQLEAVTERISFWVAGLGERDVPTQMIGEKIMAELRQLDHVAYVRFASVYRNFQDVQDFVEVLRREERAENATSSPGSCPTDFIST